MSEPRQMRTVEAALFTSPYKNPSELGLTGQRGWYKLITELMGKLIAP